MRNIVLIGMPGAGKSTVGVLLAKATGKRFVDTDLVIQEERGRLLQEIIDTGGLSAFLAAEEASILGETFHNAVVATGGSVVFSGRAMQHLKSGGTVIHLRIPFAEMERRLRNAKARGIVLFPGQSLRDLYDQRLPLYERYADTTIDCSEDDAEEVVQKILRAVAAEEKKR